MPSDSFGVLFQVSLLAPRHFATGETVRFAGDSDLVGDNGRWTRAVAEEWAEKTNNTLEYISKPADATATLQLYLQNWGSKSADVDGPRHSNRWTCAFLRPSSSLKADHVATLVHPDSLSLSGVGSPMGGALVLENQWR